jgi:uncharacterized membrane protein
LLKWKLVLVAALSAVGLGLNTGGRSHPVVLVAVPLVCIYVDLLCRHLNLRIQLIAEFIRTCPEREGNDEDNAAFLLRQYERYVPRHANAFVLEDWALELSTKLISLTVVLYGIIGQLLEVASNPTTSVGVVLAASGIAGLGLSVLIDRTYHRQRDSLAERRHTEMKVAS